MSDSIKARYQLEENFGSSLLNCKVNILDIVSKTQLLEGRQNYAVGFDTSFENRDKLSLLSGFNIIL